MTREEFLNEYVKETEMSARASAVAGKVSVEVEKRSNVADTVIVQAFADVPECFRDNLGGEVIRDDKSEIEFYFDPYWDSDDHESRNDDVESKWVVMHKGRKLNVFCNRIFDQVEDGLCWPNLTERATMMIEREYIAAHINDAIEHAYDIKIEEKRDHRHRESHDMMNAKRILCCENYDDAMTRAEAYAENPFRL